MTPIQVFLCDDSTVIRRLVADALAGDPGVAVCGQAGNGKQAVPLIKQLRPDVVVLDVEMPEMDGLQTLEALRAAGVRVPVIMFSSETRRGAAATLDALARGAADYVTKPAGPGGPAAAMAYVRAALVPKIKALACRPGAGPSGEWRPAAPVIPRSGPVPAPAARVPHPPAAGRPAPVTLVAVGVSTGGPEALAALLPALPADLPVPVVIVQHMPPVFTRLLAERLGPRVPLPVAEAADGEPVRPGRVYLAPGGFHLVVTGGRESRLRLTQDPPENFCRPAVDVLFRAAAKGYGAGVLAVVLTGMGQDGKLGCEAVRAAGGRVLAQDQATSVVWGMPGAVVRAGLADEILPLDRIAAAVARRATGRPAAV